MKLQQDPWDDDERQALRGFDQELDALRTRHANDVPFDVLRAADAEVLPAELQASMSEHLTRSAWSRALVDGADAGDSAFDARAEDRLLARVRKTSSSKPASNWATRSWVPALAAAAVLVVMVGVLRSGPVARWFARSSPPAADTPIASAPRTPLFVLALERPEVKLTQQALVLRSDAREGRFLDDLAPAVKSYNAGDYVEADRQFGLLQARYPRSVEVAFHRAIAQLFLNDASGARQSLQAARRLDDGAFAPEIAWYLAVAAERMGDQGQARAELDPLCRGTSAFKARACEASPKLDSK